MPLYVCRYDSRVGIDSLRVALRPHIDARWSALLDQAAKTIDARMTSLEQQLHAPPDAEGESLDDFVHRFCRVVHSLLKGSTTIAAAAHGETLQQEQVASTSGPLCAMLPSAAERSQALPSAAERY